MVDDHDITALQPHPTLSLKAAHSTRHQKRSWLLKKAFLDSILLVRRQVVRVTLRFETCDIQMVQNERRAREVWRSDVGVPYAAHAGVVEFR